MEAASHAMSESAWGAILCYWVRSTVSLRVVSTQVDGAVMRGIDLLVMCY